MAFETAYLQGGLIESADSGVVNYRRILALFAAVLANTDAGHQTTFRTEFLALFGSDRPEYFAGYSTEQQERICKWARLEYLKLILDNDGTLVPDYADEPYFFTYYEDQWLTLDKRMIDAICFATERFFLVEFVGSVSNDITTFLRTAGFPATPAEILAAWNSNIGEAVLALLRVFDTDFQAPTDLDEAELDLESGVAATRYKDQNFLTHLIMRGWMGDCEHIGIAVATSKEFFNTITNNGWADDALAATLTEMSNLWERLGGMGELSGVNHKLLRVHAELMAHGFAPQVVIQNFELLAGGIAITSPGAIWLEPQGGVKNVGAFSANLKMFVPAGVTIDTLQIQWNHPQGNSLHTRYINFADATIIDADSFIATNNDSGGVGYNRIAAAKAAGWAGGASGTVVEIGSVTVNYLGNPTPAIEISPNPYRMVGVINTMLEGATDRKSLFEVRGHRILSGLMNDGSKNYEFAFQG